MVKEDGPGAARDGDGVCRGEGAMLGAGATVSFPEGAALCFPDGAGSAGVD